MTRRLLTIAAAVAALLLAPSAALAKRGDRNHDRIPDRWERHFHLSVSRNQAKLDQDHDGLKNKQEFKNHTNPRRADTDGDGLGDGDEVARGDDPLDPDSDGDGVEDGQESGGGGEDQADDPGAADPSDDQADDPGRTDDGSGADDGADDPDSSGD